MYVPKNMTMHEDVIGQFINDNGFGLLISPDMQTTRLPLLFEPNTGEFGTIMGHMAKANPQWRNLDSKRVSVVFSGPHAYISPRWYVSRPAVPTWNYASVQCFGTFQQLDTHGTQEAIERLMHQYEPDVVGDVSLMPKSYMDKLLNAEVGFCIHIDEIHAKEKLGQHKSVDDQKNVFNALNQSSHPDSKLLASYMRQRNLGIGEDN